MTDLAAAVGLVPERTADPVVAATLVARDGAAILTGRAVDEAAARAVAADTLGPTLVALPPPTPVREGGEGDRTTVGAAAPLPLHTDGFAYGDHAPDHIYLLCVSQGTAGGASFLADGHALVDALDPDLRAFLHDTEVDLTEPGMHATRGPCVLARPHGLDLASHRVIRRTPFMRPLADDPDPTRTEGLLERWREATRSLTPVLPRFTIVPGEALCVDNERVLHGRDPFEGERFLWRIWAWSTAGPAPPEGELHSDSRYAVTDPEAAATIPPELASQEV